MKLQAVLNHNSSKWKKISAISLSARSVDDHSLPQKWVSMFIVPFLLLPNSRVRIYVDNTTKIMSVRRNGGKAKQLPKLVIHGM